MTVAGTGRTRGPRRECLRVGLVNNMPDGAFSATEAQFRSLLASGSPDADVQERLYTLPGISRSPQVEALVRERYHPLDDLFSWGPDVVVITGSEPLAPVLSDEPYWDELVEVIDWAVAHTRSLALSCLSAHAALLHVDGLRREALPRKCSGVFRQAVNPRHPLAPGLPASLVLPHSRHNGVRTDDLERHGYDVLTDSEVGWGVATRRRGDCLMVLFQGHPEYDADTLLREYRRDLGRSLTRGGGHPSLPAGYLDEESTRLVTQFHREHVDRVDADGMREFPFDEIAARLTPGWVAPVRRLVRNWLSPVVSGARPHAEV